MKAFRFYSRDEQVAWKMSSIDGLALGGNPGHSLAERLAIPVSKDTLLRSKSVVEFANKELFDMTQTSPADLARHLKEFSRLLEVRIREFNTNGEFSTVHEDFVSGIRKRHAELSSKVDEAIRQGTTWDVIKTELTRDYESLFDTLLRWEERLDAESMKKNRK